MNSKGITKEKLKPEFYINKFIKGAEELSDYEKYLVEMLNESKWFF